MDCAFVEQFVEQRRCRVKSREYLLRRVCAPGTVHAGGTVIDKLTVSGGHEVCKDGTTAYCNFIMSEGARYLKRKSKNAPETSEGFTKEELSQQEMLKLWTESDDQWGKTRFPKRSMGISVLTHRF